MENTLASLARRRNIGFAGPEGELLNDQAAMDTSRPIINNESLRQLRQPNAMVNDQTGQQQNFQSVQKTTVGGFPAEVDQQGNVSIYHPNGPVYTTTAEIQRQQAQARMQQQIADMPRRKAMAEIQDKEAEAGLKQAELRGGGGKPTFNADLGGYVYPPNEQNPQGRFVPIGGAKKPTKPLTEFQGKAALFGSRAAAASDLLNTLGTEESGGAKTLQYWQDVPLVGRAVNAMASPTSQNIAQAQRDFVNAVLRLESGATISPSEFQNATQQYFPQPGDNPQVIEQKKLNRERAISGLSELSGESGTDYIKKQRETAKINTGKNAGQQAKQPPQIGEIRMGHTYIGGDPASPNSWRK